MSWSELVPPRARAGAAVAGIALVGWLVYGRGFESYDPMWALLWGRDVIEGRAPGFDALAIAPTPHPLSVLTGIVAAAFGSAGPAVMAFFGHVSLGVLGWAAWRFGRATFGSAVGIIFALFLFTSPPVVDESLRGVVDLPFLALVLWAAALEAERPRTGDAPFAVLAVAGLLRPEAWLLAPALLAYRAYGGERPVAPARRVVLLVLAPLIWVAMDTVVTGDPLHSVNGTKSLGALLGAPTGLGAAFQAIPDIVRVVLPGALAWIGLAGLLLGLIFAWERSRLPAAVMGLGLLGWLGLGLAGLPVELRYGLLPAAVLGLFAAVALLGWRQVPAGTARRWWRVGSIVAAVIALVVASSGNELRGVLERRTARVEARDGIRDLFEAQPARAAAMRCDRMLVRQFLLVPSMAYRARIDPSRLTIDPGENPPAALAFQGGRLPPQSAGPAVAANQRWRLHARC